MFASFLFARKTTALLWWAGIACFALSFVFLLLPLVDARLLNGVSVWTKPWKFHVSVSIHLLTLAWAIALLPTGAVKPRAIRIVTWVAVGSAVVELAYIVFRAALGEASHFNVSTPFAAAMYSIMGIGAVSLTACAAVVGWWVLRAKGFAHGRALQLGLGLGLILGFVLGTISGGYVSAQPGHWVGGTLSDAGGLPIVNWSRDGGDLRVAHFFGLHAMQGLPVLAWASQKLTASDTAVKAIILSSLVYCGLVAVLFFRAVAGQPFLALGVAN